jgi:hypothetical protein
MAYSKTSNKTQDKDIKYLSKDFNNFRDQLMDFAQVYFPNTFNDFSEGSPGMMFLEMAAYVGDILSFYTDTQLKETFLALAQEKENLYNIAYSLGYRPKVTTTSTCVLDIYQLVPSKLDGTSYKPDFNYALKVESGAIVKSTEGTKFRSETRVDFDYSSSFDPTEINIYQLDSNNNPQYYLLKKKVRSIAAEPKQKAFSVGTAQKYLTLDVQDADIIGVEKVEDQDGNIYYEVPYMAQDTIYEDVENTGANDPELEAYNNQTPYLLKLKRVPRRFVTRFSENGTLQLQFGAGISDKSDEQVIPNPDNIGLGLKDGRSKLDIAWDPSNFLFTKTYGIPPSNTTLTVNYLKGGGLQSNVGANTVNKIETLTVTNNPNLNTNMLNFCKESIACTNPNAAQGGGRGDTIEEIRMNTMAAFAAQNRVVTKEDYIIRTLSMPARFGRVSKAYVQQDDQISPLTTEPNRIPNPLAINLYTLGYNKLKQLTTLGEATKQNLSTYLEQHRMLTDAINIKDAFIINLSVEFEIVTFKSFNNQAVLLDVISELREYFDIDKWQVNQPIIIQEVYNLIGGVTGVMSVSDVRFNNKNGELLGYSPYKYGFKEATRNNVIYPSLDPSIFEIKYPNRDITGRVITY